MKRLLLPGLLLVLSLAACSGLGAGLLQSKVPETDRWLVAPHRPGEPVAERGTLHLSVPGFHVSRAFAERTFLYLQADGRWVVDPWREFLVPPNQMIADATRLWLRDSGRFATVQAGESRQLPDLVLEADITALYGDFSAKPAQAVFAMRVLALDAESRVRFRAPYERRIDLADDKPGTLAKGWSQAVAAILTKLEQDLAKELRDE